MAGGGGGDDHLIHQAAGVLGIILFRFLAEEGELHAVELLASEGEEGEAGPDLDGGAAGEAATDGKGLGV